MDEKILDIVNTTGIDDEATRKMLKEGLFKALKDLSDREERIIKLRYGLEDDNPRTLEEVAAEFGLTSEEAREIEVTAIKKLRHPTRSKYFKK